MQISIRLLALLPWFASLVAGATVLTSPANSINILQPQRLNNSNGFPEGLIVVDKERGHVLPALDLFYAGILTMAYHLVTEDSSASIPSQAWTLWNIIIGVSTLERRGNRVQRRYVELGIYFLFFSMKEENDFRSGVFEVRYLGQPVCDLVILPAGSSGLKDQPSFAQITRLAPPPSPTAHSTNGSLQVLGALGEAQLQIRTSYIQPLQPLKPLNILINVLDMLATAAWHPAGERVQRHTESTVPNSGVTTSINPALDAKPPRVFTYLDLAEAAPLIFKPDEQAAARRLQLYLDWNYIGEITVTPLTFSAAASPLIEANINASTDTATARRKRSMAGRL